MRRQNTNHYATLGLDRQCTAEQIRDAYRVLAKRFHPDLNHGSAEAVDRTQELNAAYEILGDPDQRRAYDESLKSQPRRGASSKSSRPKQNIAQDVLLRLQDFFKGTSLEVRVNDAGNPDGPETYTLEVPPATAPGTRFKVAREGAMSGGHISVRVKPRPDFQFKTRGSDLRCDLKIRSDRAAQGGTEMVRSVTGGMLRVQIPRGAARGEIIRIEGEGLPKTRGGRGDLLVRITYRPDITIRRMR
ncbi:MAG TPA: DnaJ C-terminal domain-containing protein [Roseimicrobium sp.]|nr:DnaJ C-terminal domain-containing protein [Roseimicrobium sp.]